MPSARLHDRGPGLASRAWWACGRLEVLGFGAPAFALRWFVRFWLFTTSQAESRQFRGSFPLNFRQNVCDG